MYQKSLNSTEVLEVLKFDGHVQKSLENESKVNKSLSNNSNIENNKEVSFYQQQENNIDIETQLIQDDNDSEIDVDFYDLEDFEEFKKLTEYKEENENYETVENDYKDNDLQNSQDVLTQDDEMGSNIQDDLKEVSFQETEESQFIEVDENNQENNQIQEFDSQIQNSESFEEQEFQSKEMIDGDFQINEIDNGNNESLAELNPELDNATDLDKNEELEESDKQENSENNQEVEGVECIDIDSSNDNDNFVDSESNFVLHLDLNTFEKNDCKRVESSENNKQSNSNHHVLHTKSVTKFSMLCM